LSSYLFKCLIEVLWYLPRGPFLSLAAKTSGAMKIARWLTAIFLILALILGGVAFWLFNAVNTQVSHKHDAEYITISQGQGASQILRTLTEQGVIQAPLATKLYLRYYDQGKLQAGDYQFSSPISPKEVIARLKDGRKRTQSLVIPEGWTRFEIAKRLVAQFPASPPVSEKEVLEMMEDTDLIKDIAPGAENLEGYLYPTTYEIELGTHPKSIIRRMVGQFKRIWRQEWDEQAQVIGKSREEIITIASLIENESKIDAERALVSSVIYNRLRQRIPLGIDATNVYIAKLLGRWDGIIHKSDVEVDHPYNTRKITGLPPGPISSASESAIKAALEPSKTDFLYYVLNVEKGDGSHHFYATATEFAKGKRAYQKWLAKQR